MTEAEWNVSTDPQAMLKCLNDWDTPGLTPSERKLHLLEDAWFERFVLNLDDMVVQTNYPPGAAHFIREIFGNPWRPVTLPEIDIMCSLCDGEGTPGHGIDCPNCRGTGFDKTCPYLTPLVRTMAQTIYDERRFEDCPILADALSDAGCDNGYILNHLRNRCPLTDVNGWHRGMVDPNDCPLCSGEIDLGSRAIHVRGCHVLDLLLGKE